MDDIHGGDVWSVAERYDLPADKIIDFSASINPLFLSHKIKHLIVRNMESLRHYPDPHYKKLRSSLAESIDVSPENILVGNGSTEFIYSLLRVLNPENVLIPVPSFSEYEIASRQMNANPVFLFLSESDSFKLPLQHVIDGLRGIQILFLCNPHSPTGVLYEKGEVLRIIEECEKRGIWVILDEAFIEFIPDFKKVSFASESLKRKNLIVLRSLTKFFAIPGLRLGFVVGHEDIIKKIKYTQEPWQVNAVANAVGCEIVKDLKYISQSLELIKKERAFLLLELENLNGLKLFSSVTNFIMASLTPLNPPLESGDFLSPAMSKGGNRGITSKGLHSILASKGILIRDLSTMRGLDSRFFRFAVRDRSDNKKLIHAIKEALSNVC
ncbi:MAG: aminotransferase class I/II-fold pyridoxal phosphate-dependent enzyme [Nitrospinae bacterium]|nr:aminotransferase class I/II-fold pyridoxal phosphate-dependent enzyme [Nitrospinota bacterium]